MPNDYFNFKHFTIKQSDCAMKVGTDGVLLGAWVNVIENGKILDVGTGTGLLALMLAQRTVYNAIDAVEIDSKSLEQATFNVLKSEWTNRISVYNVDFFDFNPSYKYNLIVCNPPFYKNSFPALSNERAIARQQICFSIEKFISKAASMLETNGTLSFILPADDNNLIDKYLANNDLFLNRICFVQPTPNKPAHRILVEVSLEKRHLIRENIIIEYARHSYSDDFLNLTSPFYL